MLALVAFMFVAFTFGIGACDSDTTSQDEEPPPTNSDGRALTGTLTFLLKAYTQAGRGVYEMDLASENAVLSVDAVSARRNAAGQYGLVQGCGSSPGGVQVAFANAQGIVTDAATPCIDKTVDFSYPTISPDGALVTFQDRRGSPDRAYVLVNTTVVANRQGEEVAVFPGYIEPAWTPDGRLLLSGTGSSSVPFGLYLTDRNLQPPTRISGDQIQAFAGTPDVHPSGDRVAFSYNNGLWQMNLDGTGFERLYRYEYPLAYPAWSPDGTMLAFVDRELIHGPRAIFFLDESGTFSQVPLPLQGTDHPAGPLSWVE